MNGARHEFPPLKDTPIARRVMFRFAPQGERLQLAIARDFPAFRRIDDGFISSASGRLVPHHHAAHQIDVALGRREREEILSLARFVVNRGDVYAEACREHFGQNDQRPRLRSGLIQKREDLVMDLPLYSPKRCQVVDR